MLNRPPPSWPAPIENIGVGGRAKYFPFPATYLVFDDDTGEEWRWEATIDIGDGAESMYEVPSILGWDVLQHFRLELDWTTREVLLLRD